MFVRNVQTAQQWVSRTDSSISKHAKQQVRHAGRQRTGSVVEVPGSARSAPTAVTDDTMAIIQAGTVAEAVPWYLFRPDTKRKLTWDLYVGLLILYSAITVPLRAAFGAFEDYSWSLADDAVDACFAVDIILNFFTAFMDKESHNLVVVLPTIWFRYLRTWFVIDVVSTLPLAVIGGLKIVRVVRLSRLLKLLRLLRLSALAKRADVIVDVLGIPQVFLRMVGILLKIVLMAHLTCCLWWGVAVSEYSANGESFAAQNMTIASESIYDAPIDLQYVTVVYFTLVTLFGIGYGEYVPFTTNERILCIIVVIAGSASVGFLIGNISSVVDSRNSRRSQRMAQVKQFMRDRDFPSALRGRVRRYFQYYLSKKSMFDEQVCVCLWGSLPCGVSGGGWGGWVRLRLAGHPIPCSVCGLCRPDSAVLDDS